MNTLDAAIHRVVNIWDCPECDAPIEQPCYQNASTVVEGLVHRLRLPVWFSPDDMVRTTLTEQRIARILTDQPCTCTPCRRKTRKLRLAA